MTGRPQTYEDNQYVTCIKKRGDATARDVADMLYATREHTLKRLKRLAYIGILDMKFKGRSYYFSIKEVK